MPAVARPPPLRPLGAEDQKLKDDLVRRLEETRGNASEVARAMRKARMEIHRWMKRFGLDVDAYRR